MTNDFDPIYQTTEAARLLGYKDRHSLWRLVREGKLPPPIKLTQRRSGWKKSVLNRFIREREAETRGTPLNPASTRKTSRKGVPRLMRLMNDLKEAGRPFSEDIAIECLDGLGREIMASIETMRAMSIALLESEANFLRLRDKMNVLFGDTRDIGNGVPEKIVETQILWLDRFSIANNLSENERERAAKIGVERADETVQRIIGKR